MFAKALATNMKATLENQMLTFTALTSAAFDGGAKIVNLNMDIAKVRLQESSAALNQLMSAKNPQEYLSLAASQTHQNIEKALTHYRNVADIASTTQAEMTRIVKAKISEASAKEAG
jgi:phasin family protein